MKDLLRFCTSGSVDDGKSTLLGRILYETNRIPEDQYNAVIKASEKRGKKNVDLSLLLDGLKSEREQGITIDVAYRYFETNKRKFIVADTPGHEQYTRNMVTGSSNSELAIILIDARLGVQTQSKRHGFINSLLGIPHLIVAINKMDLVNYSKDVYDKIVKEYTDFSQKLNIQDITFIPISALEGDNVCFHTENLNWYTGETILQRLENVVTNSFNNQIDFRLPIQYVIRPNLNFRGFAGRISSGSIKLNDNIEILPSRKQSKIKKIYRGDIETSSAQVDDSVIITLEDEIDISRGDMVVKPGNIPFIGSHIISTMCWFDEEDINISKQYILKHTTQKVPAFISNVIYKIDVNTLHRVESSNIKLNDIFKVEIETTKPLFFDSYIKNRNIGSFILIDPDTNNTVAAGMIKNKNINKNKDKNLSDGVMADYIGEKGSVYWFTGLSGSGKSTIAYELSKKIQNKGKKVVILDGDNIRQGLSKDLGFSLEDRKENLRRVAEVAKLFSDAGITVITSFITPTEKDRKEIKNIIGEKYIEVFIQCSLKECERRDVKGLYKKVRNGELKQFTGISSPFEEPLNSNIILNTEIEKINKCVNKLLKKDTI